MDYGNLLQLMIANLNQGLIVTDNNLKVLFYYEPYTDIGGMEPDSAIGKSIFEIFPELTPKTSTFYYAIKNKKPLLEYVQCYCNNKGKRVTTVTSTIPIIINDEVVGAFEIYRDFSQVKNQSNKFFTFDEEFKGHKDSAVDNGTRFTFDDIIGESDLIYELKEKAYKVADSNSPILVYGETGTGKELLVQAIHNASFKRRQKKFISQNCAALPITLFESIFFGTASGSFTGAKESPGLFELSNGGTLFLDEVNSMDMGNQGKLLRVLQDGIVRRVGGLKTISVDSRVIATVNQEPCELVAKKILREDLFYRLNVINLVIPPLRKRKEDIPLLVNYFIKKFNRSLNKNIMGISTRAMENLMNYSWPGNVRELKHVIESAMNFTDDSIINDITLPNLTGNIKKEIVFKNKINSCDCDIKPYNEAIEEFEREIILKAIIKAEGNYSRAARILEIPRQTLYNKINKYNIKVDREFY